MASWKRFASSYTPRGPIGFTSHHYGDQARITNHPWVISRQATQGELGLPVFVGTMQFTVQAVIERVQRLKIPLHEAVMMVTENPARAIGLEAKGSLKMDADADLVVLSPELEVLRTFSGGQEAFSG